MMKPSFKDSLSSTTSADNDRRTVIIERTNGSFGFSLQSYGIHYRERTEVKVITYVDFVDPNGHASKAGLRSGDVIVSVNGQDIDKTIDHTTLVSLIQSCPDRIRMVVVFENCVRKVELHMKYIRLYQLLEAKARDYQEVCASEKSFIARLNKTRGIITGPGTYYTIQSSHPQAVPRRKHNDNKPPGASEVYSYSSNSMPRQHYVQQATMMCLAPADTKRHRSYLTCIGRQPDCNCCFRPDDKSSSPSSTITRPKTPRQPRPRSCHIPSCYKPPESDLAGDESYLIQTSTSKVNAYGGYGFGYDWPSKVIDPVQQQHKNYAFSGNIPFDRKHCASIATGNKSTEDLLLSTRMKNQCHLTQSPRHQNQESPLDSIAFYTRPSLPAITADPNGGGQNKPLKGIIRLPPAPVINSPAESDEGGFEQIRHYRTLPATSSFSSSSPRK